MRRILITGSRGFVGRHLLPALRAGLPEADLREAAFDITDREAMRAAVREARPELVIHLAAISAIGEARQYPDHAWRTNLNGTLDLANAIKDLASGCRLMFISSADAYGASFASGRALDETAVLAPLNTYAATKAAADLAVGAMAAEGLHAVRLRPFNHTGPGQSEAFAVAAFARQIARIEAGLQPPELRVGALEPARDFLDVRDVCAAYVSCAWRIDTLEPGTILNVASGVPRRIGDVLDALLAISGCSARVISDPSRRRGVDIVRAAGDAGRARALLGWVPTIDLRQTLTDVLADWRTRIIRDSERNYGRTGA